MLAQTEGKPTAKEVLDTLERVADSLLEEDMRMYWARLNEWLEQNPERDDDVASAVRLLNGLCALQALNPFYYGKLVANYGRQRKPSVQDEEEGKLIDSWVDPTDPDRLHRYSEWLRSRGYPKLADRTLALGELRLTLALRATPPL